MKFTKAKARGFTLIELLIVIAIIAVLAGLAYVALNPLARFQDSRNAQRWADVNSLVSAIKLHQVDHGGLYDEAITNLVADTYYQIGTGESTITECLYPDIDLDANCVSLAYLVTGNYLPALPMDPLNGDDSQSHYYIMKDANGYITVGTCDEELGTNSTIPTIELKR